MSMNEIETKCRELRQLQNLIAEAEQEAEAIKDALKAHMRDSFTPGPDMAGQGLAHSDTPLNISKILSNFSLIKTPTYDMI